MKNLILILILVICAQIAFSTRSKGRDKSFLKSQCKENGEKCQHNDDCCSGNCSNNTKQFAKLGEYCRH